MATILKCVVRRKVLGHESETGGDSDRALWKDEQGLLGRTDMRVLRRNKEDLRRSAQHEEKVQRKLTMITAWKMAVSGHWK